MCQERAGGAHTHTGMDAETGRTGGSAEKKNPNQIPMSEIEEEEEEEDDDDVAAEAKMELDESLPVHRGPPHNDRAGHSFPSFVARREDEGPAVAQKMDEIDDVMILDDSTEPPPSAGSSKVLVVLDDDDDDNDEAVAVARQPTRRDKEDAAATTTTTPASQESSKKSMDSVAASATSSSIDTGPGQKMVYGPHTTSTPSSVMVGPVKKKSIIKIIPQSEKSNKIVMKIRQPPDPDDDLSGALVKEGGEEDAPASMHREMKQLLKMRASSKVLSDFMADPTTSKGRKSRKTTTTGGSPAAAPLPAASESSLPSSSLDFLSELSPSKRQNMRSANAEFTQKQLKFLRTMNSAENLLEEAAVDSAPFVSTVEDDMMMSFDCNSDGETNESVTSGGTDFTSKRFHQRPGAINADAISVKPAPKVRGTLNDGTFFCVTVHYSLLIWILLFCGVCRHKTIRSVGAVTRRA